MSPCPWAPRRVLSLEERAATGRGRCGQGCHACSRTAGPGPRAVPDRPLQTALLNSAGRGLLIFDGPHGTRWRWAGVGTLPLVSSVSFEIAYQASRRYFLSLRELIFKKGLVPNAPAGLPKTGREESEISRYPSQRGICTPWPNIPILQMRTLASGKALRLGQSLVRTQCSLGVHRSGFGPPRPTV